MSGRDNTAKNLAHIPTTKYHTQELVVRIFR